MVLGAWMAVPGWRAEGQLRYISHFPNWAYFRMQSDPGIISKLKGSVQSQMGLWTCDDFSAGVKEKAQLLLLPSVEPHEGEQEQRM